MKYCNALAIVFLATLAGAAEGEELTATEQASLSELESRPLQTLTNTDLGRYLELREKDSLASQKTRDSREDIGVFAKRSVGQTYRRNAVQFDSAESDCVTFVNSMLALSVASDWPSYYILIERLRHKDGLPEYRNRNFFTLGDWLPNNAWLVKDVTAELGPPENRPAQEFTHVVGPKRFDERPSAPGSKFTRIRFLGADKESEDQEVRTDTYVPADRIQEVLPDLKTGDVVIVLVKGEEGHLHCEHKGLIIREADSVDILHSAPPRVLQEPLSRFQKRCSWIAGLKFVRLRDNAREIATQEVARLQSGIQPPTPTDMDAKIKRLRERRAAVAQPSN